MGFCRPSCVSRPGRVATAQLPQSIIRFLGKKRLSNNTNDLQSGSPVWEGSQSSGSWWLWSSRLHQFGPRGGSRRSSGAGTTSGPSGSGLLVAPALVNSSATNNNLVGEAPNVPVGPDEASRVGGETSSDPNGPAAVTPRPEPATPDASFIEPLVPRDAR